MNLIEQILEQVIRKQALITDYPKPGIIFLAIDSLLNDPNSRQKIAQAVLSSIDPSTFDAVAGIASRGYLFSGMICGALKDKGEFLVQKVKVAGDSHYVQIDTTTEYSADALQILKNTIIPGKKYLLTDDLIATGGSVQTAIKLIRQCGGIIDTVMVMTELTDFKAKEALAKEGIKLVSLLQLSQTDLAKLVHMQPCYAQNPAAPVTYQLSHHEKRAEALVKANNSRTVQVHLASASTLKQTATEMACKGLLDPLTTTLQTHEVASGVNQQPFGYSETITGASNRLTAMERNIPAGEAGIAVSIENGVRFDETTKSYFDFVHVIVKQGELVFTHTQDCCKIPAEIINAIPKDEKQQFIATWGETAKRMGRANLANDPHLAAEFGGVSRTEHLFKALCQALGQLKSTLLKDQVETQEFTVKRAIELSKKPADQFAKKGVFFTKAFDPITKPINFYNHGCPVDKWGIDPEKVARNSFQVFTTGDAFSVMSPDIEISGANIIIHVGTESPRYSPAVLLQEALQLCRCAYEHGAKSVTIALPERYHPMVEMNDFNYLLMSQFKASGANQVYFYDKNYTGKLDENNLHTHIPLTLSKQKVEGFLGTDNTTLDQQVMRLTRKRKLAHTWSAVHPDNSDVFGVLGVEPTHAALEVPELKVQPHVLLCCNANRALAEKIALSLRMRGELVTLYAIEGNGEQATIPTTAALCGASVTIIQSTRPSPDNVEESREYQKNGASAYFFEAALVARQAHLRGAKTINLINPYQFSARSDKAEDNVKGKTGAYVQHNGLLLAAAGVNQVITAECHDNHTMTGSYTGKKIKGSAVAALTVICSKLAHEWITDVEHPMKGQLRLVTPDAGAAKRTKELTEILQAILGKLLCQTRVLGEKQRDSHKDDSAIISSMNSGNVGINPNDKYLITDDETATGNTLCQAVENLSKNGAKEIEVIVVHNNMPLDWLERQLCLARFLFQGVNHIHFSDTQEMGSLATSYEQLIEHYAQIANSPKAAVEAQVDTWFKEKISKLLVDKSASQVSEELTRFKSLFSQFDTKVRVHSLANEFANKVVNKPYMGNPHAFAQKVDDYIAAIKNSQAESVVAFAGASLPAASAAALALGLPLQVITEGTPPIVLPQTAFALVGTPAASSLQQVKQRIGDKGDQLLQTNTELVFVPATALAEAQSATAPVLMTKPVAALELIYQTIKADAKLKDRPIKLLGIGDEGQVIAGQLAHLLNKQGKLTGVVTVDTHSPAHSSAVTYSGKAGDTLVSVARNSLDMGDVCIAVGKNISAECGLAISKLTTFAKVHCPYSLSVSDTQACEVIADAQHINLPLTIWSSAPQAPAMQQQAANAEARL